MKNNKQQLKDEFLNEILNSKISFNRKTKILQILDKLFRDKLGIIYLSDKELEDKDIMNRSM